MIRLHTTCLHLIYREQSTTFAQVESHYANYEDVLAFCHNFKMNVILYKKNRFDIKTESYIRKHFKIGKTLPDVNTITRNESIRLLETNIKDKCKIFVKGLYMEIYNEHLCRMEEEKKDVEIERQRQIIEELKNEIKEQKGTVINITNYMIPQLYKDVKMNPLGKENLTIYTVDDLLSIVNKDDRDTVSEEEYSDIFRRLIELIHYDERCPENHNIHITKNRSRPECIVFTESGWHLCLDLDKVIATLCATNKEFIIEIYNRQKEECDNIDSAIGSKLRFVYEKMKYYISNHSSFSVTDALYSLTKTKLPQIMDHKQ